MSLFLRHIRTHTRWGDWWIAKERLGKCGTLWDHEWDHFWRGSPLSSINGTFFFFRSFFVSGKSSSGEMSFAGGLSPLWWQVTGNAIITRTIGAMKLHTTSSFPIYPEETMFQSSSSNYLPSPSRRRSSRAMFLTFLTSSTRFWTLSWFSFFIFFLSAFSSPLQLWRFRVMDEADIQ